MSKQTSDKKLISDIRRLIPHERGEHHMNCSSRTEGQCDCYASGSEEHHKLLDEVERRLKERIK